MPRKPRPKIDREERRENALRPCRYLGYNWDDLGLYFIDREALRTAEAQFRRAVWLNPYEPEFKLHLAGCLFQQKRNEEAREWAVQAIEMVPDRQDARELLRLIDWRIGDAKAAAEAYTAKQAQES